MINNKWWQVCAKEIERWEEGPLLGGRARQVHLHHQGVLDNDDHHDDYHYDYHDDDVNHSGIILTSRQTQNSDSDSRCLRKKKFGFINNHIDLFFFLGLVLICVIWFGQHLELPQSYDQSPNALFIYLGKPIDCSVVIFIRIQRYNTTMLTSIRLMKDD